MVVEMRCAGTWSARRGARERERRELNISGFGPFVSLAEQE